MQKQTILALILIGAVIAGCQQANDQPVSTLDATAIIEQRLPTINAQLTAYAQQIDSSLPTVQANMTLAATLGPVNPDMTNNPVITATPTLIATTEQAVTGQSPTSQPASDGGFNDVNQTTQTQEIKVGQSVNGTLNSATEAHNWTFKATAGQSITIKVTGSNGSDVRVRVFDAAGTEIGNDDDSGGAGNALLTLTFQAAGNYIIRVDTWNGGAYTLSVQ